MTAALQPARCGGCRGTGYPVSTFFSDDLPAIGENRVEVMRPRAKPGSCEPCHGTGAVLAIVPGVTT